MKIWLILNSIGLLVTASMLYLTIRQVGLMLGRLGPIGARTSQNVGPRVGENLSTFLEPLDYVGEKGKHTMYIFGSDSCGVCGRIRVAAGSLASYWAAKSNIILVYDPPPKGAKGDVLAATPDGHAIPLVRSESLRGKLGIGLVPFAVMVDPTGTVLGKGLVNEMSHVESLLELIPNP
jgi:methylamine dehydrogenase accessory protein MauD